MVKFDLEKIKKKYGIKQVELANIIGLSPVTISNYCRGSVYPSVASLISMSEKLQIPIADFFSEDEEKVEPVTKLYAKCPHCKKTIQVNITIPQEEGDENQ